MADGTKIEWTDASWNPVRARRFVALPGADPGDLGEERIGWHCEHASPGCANCYAEKFNMAGRSAFTGTRLPYKPGHRKDVEIFLDEKKLIEPLRWQRPRRIFVCSMTDLFGTFVNDETIDRIFAVMALCPQHTFQVLTKRPDRMRAYFERYDAAHDHNCADMVADAAAALLGRPGAKGSDRYDGAGPGWPLPNVWLGTSVEDQKRADERIPHLLATPSAVRFLSCEPLLGPVDLGLERGWCRACGKLTGGSIFGHCDDPSSPCFAGEVLVQDWLHWIIAGGESGPRARPMHPDWARSLRDQCAAAGVPFFFKQWGEWAPHRPVAGGNLAADVRSGRVTVVHPSGRSDVEVFEATGGRNTEPGTRYVARVGKKAAGRLLDGQAHDGMPA
jgi:protein gp37